MKNALLSCSMSALCTIAQAAPTINYVTLFNTFNPGQIWVTWTTGHWILGISDQAGGPLLNAADSSVTGISQGDYWLFADPADLGTRPQLDVGLSDGTVLSAVFEVSGTPGIASTWNRIDGSDDLKLGWAQGVVDVVGTYAGVTPNGITDYYMYASLGAVPEPSTFLLFLGGALCGLTAVARRRPQSLNQRNLNPIPPSGNARQRSD